MSEQKISSLREQQENLNIAANINYDRVNISIAQIIGQRQIVARTIMRDRFVSGEEAKNARELYDYLNDQIKLILGI